MYTRKVALYFLLTLASVFLSCDNGEKEQNKEVTQKALEENFRNELERKMKSKEKLFLSFWEGMSSDEYHAVSEELIEEGVLYRIATGGLRYKTGTCSDVIVTSDYESGKLTAINLKGGECLYSLYKRKYDLPNLTNRTYSEFGELFSEVHEKALSHYRPYSIEEGELIDNGNVIIRLEQETFKKLRESIDYDLNHYWSSYETLGNIVFTYMSREQFNKLKEEFERHISRIESDKNERTDRRNQVIDEI